LTREPRSAPRADRRRHRRLQRRPCAGRAAGRTLRADHRRPPGADLLPDRRRTPLRRSSPRLGPRPHAQLSAKIQRAEIVHTGPELVVVYAQLRADCEARGDALAQRAHTAAR
jgi:hypothetical protein